MKVLHFITRFNAGGTATFLYNLLSTPDENWEHRVAFGRTNYPEFEDSRIKEISNIQILSMTKTFRPLEIIRTFFEIRRALLNEQPNIVNTHTSHAGFLVRLASRTIPVVSRPIVVHTIHGHLLYGYFSPLKTKVYITVERLLSLITDGFIVPGNIMLKELKDSRIISPKKEVAVIFPPISQSPKSWVSTKTPSRNRRLRVGWMGRLASIKRVDRLVQLASTTPDVDFFLAGSEQGFNLKEFPKNLNFSNWTTPETFWSEMDIAILTSDSEGQPLTLLEAASFGVPALTTSVGSTGDAVITGETGFVVPWNLENFRGIILEFQNNQDLLTKMGSAAYLRVAELYNPKKILNEHHAFYMKLIRKLT